MLKNVVYLNVCMFIVCLNNFRYNMGVKSVNIDQIDETNMQALIKVGVNPGEKEDYNSNIFSVIQETGLQMDNNETEAVDNVDTVQIITNQSGLRKRNMLTDDKKNTINPSSVNGEHIEEIDGEKSEKDKVKYSDDKKRSFDPIRWFGVLVPGSLKQSQTDFKKCTEIAVTVGNLQTKLESLRKNYKRLLLLKKTKYAESS